MMPLRKDSYITGIEVVMERQIIGFTVHQSSSETFLITTIDGLTSSDHKFYP